MGGSNPAFHQALLGALQPPQQQSYTPPNYQNMWASSGYPTMTNMNFLSGGYTIPGPQSMPLSAYGGMGSFPQPYIQPIGGLSYSPMSSYYSPMSYYNPYTSGMSLFTRPMPYQAPIQKPIMASTTTPTVTSPDITNMPKIEEFQPINSKEDYFMR